jgi:hypothetical protein
MASPSSNTTAPLTRTSKKSIYSWDPQRLSSHKSPCSTASPASCPPFHVKRANGKQLPGCIVSAEVFRNKLGPCLHAYTANQRPSDRH